MYEMDIKQDPTIYHRELCSVSYDNGKECLKKNVYMYNCIILLYSRNFFFGIAEINTFKLTILK